MYQRSGLGVPPEHRCYDPARPSWLPYWFDTWAEEACRFGLFPGAGDEPLKTSPLPPPPPAPPGAPQTRDEMTGGGWSPEQAAARGWETTMENWRVFFDEQAGIPATDRGMTGDAFWMFVALGLGAWILLKR